DTIFTFANNINTEHGGTHLSGFKSALTRTLNKYARDSKVIKDNEALPDGSDYLEGLVAVVSVKLPDPKFESQTKVKLSNTEIEGIVQQIVGEQLGIHLEEHPQTARAILNKASQARAAREAARKARELVRRKSPLQSGSLPGKLADCSSRDADSTELFIVEGDSAGGSAKQGRVREFQAILPIRGKILNVEKTRIDKMLGHQEIQTIISALGTGIGRDDFDLSRLRYGKVIIMTDADVDGSHIRTLLLTFFFRQMPELIEAGKVYIAQPPLFELVPKRGSRKNSRYVQDERAYEETVVNVGGENLVVTIAGSGREIRGEELQKLCRAIRALMRLEERMVRRGIPFLELVGLAREESPKLPTTYVVHRRRGEEGGVRKFLFDSEEAEEFVREIEAEIGREPVVATGEDALETREAADVVIYDLYEHESVVRLSEEIRSFGFSVRTYRLTDREDAAGRLLYEPIAHTRNADERTDEPGQPAYDLVEIFQRVQDQVERRFEVKRFKGLGEMNADQLFETTMNPASRTLLKVTVKDAYKADEYFTILMGNEVEPRRKFIQEHALDAKNLDI
ncbi:MAG TPA: toprim domain-containing protein, partial [Planctomycetota bacterium]|nr:toprim domain-containing protein [Planctomycetota bacterium]